MSLALRLGLAAAIWWAFAEGQFPSGAGAVVAAAAIVATAAAGLTLRDGAGLRRPRPHRMPRFVAFFLWRSLLGGADVARRALAPRVAIDPGFVDHDPHLAEGSARALWVAVVSVMPGTLVAEELAPGGAVRVHVIDTALPVDEELERVDAEVRLLYGLPGREANAAGVQARP